MIAILRNPQEADLKFEEGGNTGGLGGRDEGSLNKERKQSRKTKKTTHPLQLLYPKRTSLGILSRRYPLNEDTLLASCVSVNTEPSSQGKHKSHCRIRRANCAHARTERSCRVQTTLRNLCGAKETCFLVRFESQINLGRFTQELQYRRGRRCLASTWGHEAPSCLSVPCVHLCTLVLALLLRRAAQQLLRKGSQSRSTFTSSQRMVCFPPASLTVVSLITAFSSKPETICPINIKALADACDGGELCKWHFDNRR